CNNLKFTICQKLMIGQFVRSAGIQCGFRGSSQPISPITIGACLNVRGARIPKRELSISGGASRGVDARKYGEGMPMSHYESATARSDPFKYPNCSDCGAVTELFGIESGRPGCELLTFVCPKCKQIETTAVKIS